MSERCDPCHGQGPHRPANTPERKEIRESKQWIWILILFYTWTTVDTTTKQFPDADTDARRHPGFPRQAVAVTRVGKTGAPPDFPPRTTPRKILARRPILIGPGTTAGTASNGSEAYRRRNRHQNPLKPPPIVTRHHPSLGRPPRAISPSQRSAAP